MADKRHRVPVPGIITLIILSSCALVKENRDPCPCHLKIHLSGTQGGSATVQVEASGDCWRLDAVGDTVFHAYVPRGPVSVTAWSGVSEPVDGAFIIPYGTQASPLYMCQCTVNAAGDEVIVHTRLRKQFCTLRLFIEGPPGWGTPFSTRIRGSVSGISYDGIPVQGVFDFASELPENQDGSGFTDNSMAFWTVRLPRQYADSPLLLDIVMEDSTVRTFSLGSYLLDSGFDWSSPDLEDLDLSLHLSVTSLTLRYPAWLPAITTSIDI